MKRQIDADINIIKALQKLKLPMKNYKGADVIFDSRKRYESLFEHIACKSHQLKVRDIEIIPTIIADENSVYKDKKSNKCKNYFGRRKGKNKKPYLKIITKIDKHRRELIINLYTVRRKGA